MLKEHGIIFSSDMVKAILEGRKTQTRRPIKPQPECQLYEPIFDGKFWQWHGDCDPSKTPNGIDRKCPYGQAGDRLWVRETFAIESNMDIAEITEYSPPFKDGRPIQWHDDPEYGKFWDQCHYKATDPTPELCYTDRDEPGVRWKPSIYMPRWASRITLEIVAVRVERLQEITEEDAKAEGTWSNIGHLPSNEFRDYWNSLYTKKPEYQWKANPWVWVINFQQASTNPK